MGRPRWRWRWLVGPSLVALVTLGFGAAVARIFTERGEVLWGWLIAAALLALAQTYLGPWVARIVDELLDRSAQPKPRVIDEFPTPQSRTEARDSLRRLSASRAKAKVSHLDVMPVTCEELPSRHEPGSAAMAATLAGAKKVTDFFLSIPSRRMVLLGCPGSGKTILAWRIVFELLDNHPEEQLIPVVLSIGSWNPFATTFCDWLQEQLADLPIENVASTEVRNVIPVLDGFDEHNPQRRSLVIQQLNGYEIHDMALILISRSNEYKEFLSWETILTDAEVVELQPLSHASVYLRERSFGGVNAVASRLEVDSDSPLASALSSPFMLDIMAKAFLQNYPRELLESDDQCHIEQIIARRFCEAQIARSDRWRGSNWQRWFTEIAKRAHYPFEFRPNELDLPVAVGILWVAVAVALPSAAVAVAAAQSLNLKQLVGLVVGLAVANYYCITWYSLTTSPDPVIASADDTRLERSAALEKVSSTFALAILLGGLTLFVPYGKTWAIPAGALILGLVGWRTERVTTYRLLGVAIAAPCGAALGAAAYIGTEHPNLPSFILAGVVAAAPVFLIVLAGNLGSHISDGKGREGITVSPILAAMFSLPFGFFSACLIAVTALARQEWGILGFSGGLARLIIYAFALTASFLMMTGWTRIGLLRISYSAKGIFPIRLLRFLEDSTAAGILRRVGYSYEFRHPAIRRAYLPGSAAGGDRGRN